MRSDYEKNTVSASRQVQEYDIVRTVDKGARLKVLFVGNSITRHAPKPEIGWNFDWGMAASCEQNDYVHRTIALIEEKWGPVNFCTACCGEWERHYWEDEERLKDWEKARDFAAGILVIRIGENVWGIRDGLKDRPFREHFEKMIRYFAAPGAKVVVTDLFWEDFGINDDIRSVAKENGYRFVHLGDLGARDRDEYKAIGQFWHGGVAIHPNDAGMNAIAERIAKEILCED